LIAARRLALAVTELGLKVCQKRVHGGDTMWSWKHALQRSRRVLAIVQLKWREAGGGVDTVVVGELRAPQPTCPGGAFLVHIGTEIVHDGAVVALHLAIGSRVMGCGEAEGGSHALENQLPEFSPELGTTVVDDLPG
jgi:hypothetical protein